MIYKILYIVPYGLEDVANTQIDGSIEAKSIISKNYTHIEQALQDVYSLRVHYRALLYITHFKAQSIEEIEKGFRTVQWKDWIPYGTFACRCSRRGTHPFRSIDIERLCGAVILEKTNNLSVNLTQPDTIVRIIIDDTDVFIGLDLIGYDSMHKRGYRVFQHPSALNPVLAYHLVLLAGEFDSLLDPTCGGATILIEACHHKMRIPAGWFRKENLAMINLPYIKERTDARQVIDNIPANFQNCSDNLFVGIDNSPKILDGARRNIENARCSQCIQLIQADIVMQQIGFSQKFDAIVSNPPYGIRLGSPRKALRVHKAIIDLARRYLKSGGRLILITPHIEFVAETLGVDPIKQFRTFSGDLQVGIGVFEFV